MSYIFVNFTYTQRIVSFRVCVEGLDGLHRGHVNSARSYSYQSRYRVTQKAFPFGQHNKENVIAEGVLCLYYI